MFSDVAAALEDDDLFEPEDDNIQRTHIPPPLTPPKKRGLSASARIPTLESIWKKQSKAPREESTTSAHGLSADKDEPSSSALISPTIVDITSDTEQSNPDSAPGKSPVVLPEYLTAPRMPNVTWNRLIKKFESLFPEDIDLQITLETHDDTVCGACLMDLFDLPTSNCTPPPPGKQKVNIAPNAGEDVALLSSCLHLYHSRCIWTWLATENQCCQCKQRFGALAYYDFKGHRSRALPIHTVHHTYQVPEDPEEEEEGCRCFYCGRVGDRLSLMTCTGSRCNTLAHFYCANLEEKINNWNCDRCNIRPTSRNSRPPVRLSGTRSQSTSHTVRSSASRRATPPSHRRPNQQPRSSHGNRLINALLLAEAEIEYEDLHELPVPAARLLPSETSDIVVRGKPDVMGLFQEMNSRDNLRKKEEASTRLNGAASSSATSSLQIKLIRPSKPEDQRHKPLVRGDSEANGASTCSLDAKVGDRNFIMSRHPAARSSTASVSGAGRRGLSLEEMIGQLQQHASSAINTTHSLNINEDPDEYLYEKFVADSAAGRARSDSAAGRARSDSAAGRARSDSAAGRARSDSAAGEARSDSAAGEARSDSAAGEARSARAPSSSNSLRPASPNIKPLTIDSTFYCENVDVQAGPATYIHGITRPCRPPPSKTSEAPLPVEVVDLVSDLVALHHPKVASDLRRLFGQGERLLKARCALLRAIVSECIPISMVRQAETKTRDTRKGYWKSKSEVISSLLGRASLLMNSKNRLEFFRTFMDR